MEVLPPVSKEESDGRTRSLRMKWEGRVKWKGGRKAEADAVAPIFEMSIIAPTSDLSTCRPWSSRPRIEFIYILAALVGRQRDFASALLWSWRCWCVEVSRACDKANEEEEEEEDVGRRTRLSVLQSWMMQLRTAMGRTGKQSQGGGEVESVAVLRKSVGMPISTDSCRYSPALKIPACWIILHESKTQTKNRRFQGHTLSYGTPCFSTSHSVTNRSLSGNGEVENNVSIIKTIVQTP